MPRPVLPILRDARADVHAPRGPAPANPVVLTRREWLVRASALLSLPALGMLCADDAEAATTLVDHPRGGYRFLPGVPFLSLGAMANDGFEVVRTRLRHPLPLMDGLQEIARLLERAGRPTQALCGLELRSPRVPLPPEFAALNRAYMERFGQMGLLVDGRVPVARTNVVGDVPDVSVYAYSHTVPLAATTAAAPTFVLSAVPEVRNLQRAAAGLEAPDFIASGDTTSAGTLTADGLRRKLDFVLSSLQETLRVFGLTWSDVTGVGVYTLENAQPLLSSLILPRIGTAARFGLEWHHAHPPGALNLVELDARGIRAETIT